jgi:outer membrane protein
MRTPWWLFLGIVFSAWADAATVTFEQGTALAAAHNATLRAAKADAIAAEHRARAAYSGFLPDLSGDLGYSNSAGNTDFDGSGYSAGITLRQNLFSGFQDKARVDQANANVESARAALALTKAQLSHDLKTAYAGLLYAQDNVALTQNILRRLEENLRLVELRFESGRENKGSFLFSRASVAQARLDQLQARQALASAQTELGRVLGQITDELQASGAVPIVAPPSPPDFKLLVRDVPQVRAAAARERAAEADVRLARGGFYPSVDVTGSINRDGDRPLPNDNDGRRRTVGATVSIPIFSGGRDVYGTRAALSASDAASASRENVEQERFLRLKQEYASYVESVERLEVDREFLDAAQTRAGIARARYQNGLVSFEEWDRIESELIQRQKALLASQRGRVDAEAAWELAQGKGVIP